MRESRGFLKVEPPWLLPALLLAGLATVLLLSRWTGKPPLVVLTALAAGIPVAVLALVFGVILPFSKGADRARRRRLRLRVERLRRAIAEGRERDAAYELRRIVSLKGSGDPFLRKWFRRPSYPFRELVLEIVETVALKEVMGRPDDPLAHRAWMVWLRKEGRRRPGEVLRQEVADDELRRLWARAREERGGLLRTPRELLSTWRPPA